MTPTIAELKRKSESGSKTTAVAGPLYSEEMHNLDAYWRASNYLSAGLTRRPATDGGAERAELGRQIFSSAATLPGD
jgi:hypothetical protein